MKIFGRSNKNKKNYIHSRIGFSLKNPLVVTEIQQEYQFINKQKCFDCNSDIDNKVTDHLSWVLYNNKVHDILRCRCKKCGRTYDFYFDYTPTVNNPAVIPFCVQMEIEDPLPDDIFAIAGTRSFGKNG